MKQAPTPPDPETATASEGADGADAAASAVRAGLSYVCDDRPGITRRRFGKAFGYRWPDGRRVDDAAHLERIRKLAIPPAWTEVWISPDPQGHLQATGRDARGRKQHRYHPDWITVRDELKFNRMIAFGQALPEIRKRVDADLRGRPRARRTVLAAIVRLLETTLVRVGNAEYAQQNDSYGLTTLREEHVALEGSELRFEFRGKSGKTHSVRLRDRRVARVIRAMQDLPGQELFQYIDEDGAWRDVDSADVNDYLREIAGESFTAKDFRTWAGTLLACWALQEFESVDSEAAVKKNITRAIKSVAQRLGNTPAVCRKSYIHPDVIGAYVDGSLLDTLRERVAEQLREELAGLQPEEAAVLAFLQGRLKSEAAGLSRSDDRSKTSPEPMLDTKAALKESVRRGQRAHARSGSSQR